MPTTGILEHAKIRSKKPSKTLDACVFLCRSVCFENNYIFVRQTCVPCRIEKKPCKRVLWTLWILQVAMNDLHTTLAQTAQTHRNTVTPRHIWPFVATLDRLAPLASDEKSWSSAISDRISISLTRRQIKKAPNYGAKCCLSCEALTEKEWQKMT